MKKLNPFMKSKKAMVFTIISIALLSLFILSYGFYNISKDRKDTNRRIKTMNDFVFSLEEDIPRQIYISTFRIIFLFNKKISESGNYITNLNSTFEECFYNGTIYNEYQPIMNGVTFSGIKNSINEKSRKMNVDVNLTTPSISITQDNPWNIKINFQTNLKIEDENNLVSWNRTFTTHTYIPIENFEDPLYTINSNGLITKKINKTIYENFTQGTDTSNLQDHLEKSFYINSTSAPSFLDRLQGNLNANPNGIESLVYLPEFSTQGIAVKDKTCVDYIYFSSNTPSSSRIQNMPTWFKIDDAHLSTYQVDELTM